MSLPADFCRGKFVGFFFFFSSRRRHTRSDRDWSSDVCSSDLRKQIDELEELEAPEGEEEKYEALFENAEAQLEKGEEDPKLLTDENNDLFAGVNKEAKALGLGSCAEEEEEG